MEAETINAGTKLITRGTAQQQVGEHIEKCWVKTEARWRCTLGEEGCRCPTSEEERSNETVSRLHRSALLGLSSFWPVNLVSFPTPDVCWDPPLDGHTSLSQGGYQSEGFWEDHNSLWTGVIPWLLTHREPFCVCVVFPLSPESGEQRSFNPLLKQVLLLFVLAVTITLTIVWLLP